jgi:hypothetical protein
VADAGTDDSEAAVSGAVGAAASAAAWTALDTGPGVPATTPTTLEGVDKPNARASD